MLTGHRLTTFLQSKHQYRLSPTKSCHAPVLDTTSSFLASMRNKLLKSRILLNFKNRYKLKLYTQLIITNTKRESVKNLNADIKAKMKIVMMRRKYLNTEQRWQVWFLNLEAYHMARIFQATLILYIWWQIKEIFQNAMEALACKTMCPQ